jgi:membrane associated rhomboid family serine protease
MSMDEPVPDDAVIVHRSPDPLQCEERGFVLTAVGIANERRFDGEQHVLSVAANAAAEALAQLADYEREAQAARAANLLRESPPADLPYAWVGAAAFAALLYFTSLALARGWGRLDAFAQGELTGAGVQHGQWWRALTALTLHRDPEHLLGNLLFGVWIGYLAGARLGPGVAWFATLLAAAAANLFDAMLGPADYRSVGASTAVFAALGLLSALGWRERHAMGRRGFARWSPLVAGLILLGWTGSEGENTDRVAHGLGFLFGAACGAGLGVRRVRAALRAAAQWPAGLLALALIALAWWQALRG